MLVRKLLTRSTRSTYFWTGCNPFARSAGEFLHTYAPLTSKVAIFQTWIFINVIFQKLLPFFMFNIDEISSEFRECFQKMETLWRFAEFVAKFCENSLEIPKPNEISHHSIHFVNSLLRAASCSVRSAARCASTSASRAGSAPPPPVGAPLARGFGAATAAASCAWTSQGDEEIRTWNMNTSNVFGFWILNT